MSRALNDLSSYLQPKAFEFVARAAEAGIPVMIVDTVRTTAEQTANVAKGVSWTMNSKHLPRNLRGILSVDTSNDTKADAFDVVPYDQFQLHGPDKLEWDDTDPAWQILGKIGEKLGLKWGVLKPGGKRIDLGHFELYTDQIF